VWAIAEAVSSPHVTRINTLPNQADGVNRHIRAALVHVGAAAN
jgi:hypothetical protein